MTTSICPQTLIVGGTNLITAGVTSGLGSASVSQMAFGSYDTTVATVNPTLDSTSPYSTTVTAVTPGSAAVWATASLSDGRFCQSSGSTDCNISVPAPAQCTAPVPLDPPTPPLCAPVSGTSIITWQWNAVLDISAGPGKYATDYEIGIYNNSSGALANVPNNNTWQPVSTFGCASGGTCQWQTLLPAGTYYSQLRAKGICTVPLTWSKSNNVTILPCSGPLYTISGKLFNDPNHTADSNGTGVSDYTDSFTVSSVPAASVDQNVNGPGSYRISNLPAGTYIITFGGLPAGEGVTYLSSPGVTIGTPCQVPLTNPLGTEATCATIPPGKNCLQASDNCSGSVSNLNAGVAASNESAWIQTTGADLRLDKGTFVNLLPPATYTSVPFVGIPGAVPGVIFTGEKTFPHPNYGSGQASPTNWSVGSPQFPELFTDTHGNIPTSYTFLVSTAQASSIPLTPTISSVDSSIQPGIYMTGGDLTIDSPVTFGTGNFVILVNGSLDIKAKITVPVGSTAVFSVKDDITVDKAFGEAHGTVCNTTTHAGCDIEGLYSADHSFIADGDSGNNCPTEDLRLNVAGSVIANAGRGVGVFENKRSLCADNSTDPSVSFTERPDFMLNYPSFVRQIPRAWQELAP